MTVNEAIAQVDDLIKNNPIDRELKVAWLSSLDHLVFLDTSDGEDGEFLPHTDGRDATLLIPAPFDMLYIDYLKMKIYGELSDIPRYNNSMLAFNSAFSSWRCRYITEKRPMSSVKLSYM